MVRQVKPAKSGATLTPKDLKPLEFLESSRDGLRAMPDSVRHDMGLELMRVQFGGEPRSFKPMPTVGAGAARVRYKLIGGEP